MRFRRATSYIVFIMLAACASTHRAETAAAAKAQMVGMSKEDVLACMGPAKKKAVVGATEVWSYLSTDGSGSYVSGGSKYSGLSSLSLYDATGSHSHSFCTVNIVMKNGVVTRVNYNGPTDSGLFSSDEQCGYAVTNCVNNSGAAN